MGERQSVCFGGHDVECELVIAGVSPLAVNLSLSPAAHLLSDKAANVAAPSTRPDRPRTA